MTNTTEAATARDLLAEVYDWMCEPDAVEGDNATMDWLVKWMERRPLAKLGMVAMLMPDDGSGRAALHGEK